MIRGLYNNLLAPEWRKVITPSNLANSVIGCLRVITRQIAALIGVNLDKDTTRPYYRVLSVRTTDIETTETASDDPWLVAGAEYRFKSDVKQVDAFGVGFAATMSGTTPTALNGQEFVYSGGYYYFNSGYDPSDYGTVGIDENNNTTLALPAVGGDVACEYLPLDHAFHHTPDECARTAIDETVYGTAPNGLNRHLIEATGHCRLPNSGGVLSSWVEGGYQIGIDSQTNTLVYAPGSGGLSYAPENIDGCILYEWPYIINNSNGQQSALNNFALTAGSVHINVTVSGSDGTTLSGASVAKLPLNSGGLIVTSGGRCFNF